MARTLKDALADDALNAFLNLDEFAEKVVYRPHEGKPREIAAIVDRAPRARVSDFGKLTAPKLVVYVANHELDGLDPSQFVSGGDKLDVAEQKGDTRAKFEVLSMTEQDDGLVRIEVK